MTPVARYVLLLVLLIPSAWAEAPITVIDSRGATAKIEGSRVTLLSYRTDAPPQLHLGRGVLRCKLNRKPCAPAPVTLALPPGIPQKATARLNLELTTAAGRATYEIWLVPEDFPWFALKGTSRLPGPIVFSASQEAAGPKDCDLVKLSPQGELVFFMRPGSPCFDFREHVVGQERFYSYQKINSADKTLGTFGPRVILDHNLKVVEIAAHEFDGHEFHWLGKGHWIGIEKTVDRFPNGAAYLNRHIRERKDGRIIFEWGLNDFEAQVGTAAAPQAHLAFYQNEVVLDYIHLNTVQLLSPTALLVGLGNNGVAYVDRDTKRASWVLGGLSDQFSLRYEQHPFFSHGATFDPRAQQLWLLSNYIPNRLRENYSRIIRYDIDVATKKLKEARVFYQYPNLSLQMGGLEIFGDIVSLSTGDQLDQSGADLVELSPAGEHFSLSFTAKAVVVYRFYRPRMSL